MPGSAEASRREPPEARWIVRRLLVVASVLVLVTANLAVAGPVGGTEAGPVFTVDKVFVNKTGGVSVMGTVDCSAAVAEQWPNNTVPPETYVLVNVSWKAYQPAGRRMLMAELGDSQASPCWANATEFVDPGRCVELKPGIWGQCRWDSSNWGQDGYQYGTGKFVKGMVHVDATLEGGFWGDVDAGELFDFFEIRSVDLRATRQ